jgi:SAM-dependent methyltransferase
MTQFDPVAFKTEQRANWNAVSTAWASWQEAFERGATTVTARLLELSGVRPGHRVLDIATGHGEPAVSAARIVGPTGRVVGVDLSPAMVEVARQRAAGLDNAEFLEGDMESIGDQVRSFDVVLSRFGLMFAVDHVAAFRKLADVLVPGGVLAAAVWGPPATHLLATGPAALAEHVQIPAPPPDTPGPFSMSDPQQLTEELTTAGFVDVSITEHTVPFHFGSIEDYLRFNREVLPPTMLETVRDRLGSEDDPGAWKAVARAVEKYADPDGSLPLPSVALCVRAVVPEEGD